MITYEYICTACDEGFEVEQSIKEKAWSRCGKCGQETLERVINGGLAVFVSAEAKTLSQLADRNTKKMGTYELQDRRHADEQGKIDKKNLAQQELARKYGCNPITYKEIKPKPGKLGSEKINKMTPAQKQKYISDGKTP